MHVTLVPSELRLPEPKAPRSFGVHASTLIRSIAIKNRILKPEFVEEISLVEVGQDQWWESLTPASRLRIAIGLAWEEWYLPTLADQGVLDHPGEMQVDGIYMTHDGESIDAIVVDKSGTWKWGSGTVIDTVWVPSIHEVKGTFKSTKTVGDLSTQWLWLSQTRAYCKGLRTRICYLHVLFLCGDYSFPITPQLRVWRIEYTQAEIDDNWEMLVDEMNHLKQIEADKEIPF